MKVLLTGATGFVGTHLKTRLEGAGHTVLTVSRGPSGDHDWSDASLSAGVAASDAVIHLAGAGIFDKRWSDAYKREMIDSRVDTTRKLAGLCKQHEVGCFLTSSAIGYYGAREEPGLDESASPGDDFLAKLCMEWEAAADEARQAGVRTCTVRTGVVLGLGGGALKAMMPPFKLGAGGPLGTGLQWVSWVHIQDLCSLFVHLLENESSSGIYNGTAPNPVSMTQFARALGRALGRPAFIKTPGFAMKLLLGGVASVLLEGQHVRPVRAMGEGFVFLYRDIDTAFAELVGPPAAQAPSAGEPKAGAASA